MKKRDKTRKNKQIVKSYIDKHVFHCMETSMGNYYTTKPSFPMFDQKKSGNKNSDFY